MRVVAGGLDVFGRCIDAGDVGSEASERFGQEPRALLGTGHVKAGELIPGRLLAPTEIQQILRTPS